MKKLLFIFLGCPLIIATQSTFAQLINPDFETWTPDVLVPTAMNPNTGNPCTGWWDYNFFNHATLGSSPISVKRCTDTVHTGSYSCRIESVIYTPYSWGIYKYWGIPFIGHEYSDTLGILYNGYADEMTSTYKPGIPFTQKISQFKFYYQYKPNGVDTAECRVSLMKAGAVVAGGVFATDISTGSSGWQQAVIDMYYLDTITPDTMLILFSAASLDTKPKPGSVFWIDDVSVTSQTGINMSLASFSNVEISPNPSNGIFSIRQQEIYFESHSIEIFNILGEIIFSSTDNSKPTTEIDISHAPGGIYFVKLDDGKNIHTEKIVVQ